MQSVKPEVLWWVLLLPLVVDEAWNGFPEEGLNSKI